jgi:hypothetical protein
MSIVTMILGQSGTGKTASLRNMQADNTLLIKVLDKPLPFRAKEWKNLTKDGGNVFASDHYGHIISAIQKTTRDIIVIDDYNYLMTGEYMRRSAETGFAKFSDIGNHAWAVIDAACKLPAGKRVYIMAHTQTDDFGREKIKTIGKLLDDKVTLEGLVTICLKTVVQDGKFYFSTQNNGADTVKSPIGLFDSSLIENDLNAVDTAISDYYSNQLN